MLFWYPYLCFLISENKIIVRAVRRKLDVKRFFLFCIERIKSYTANITAVNSKTFISDSYGDIYKLF